MAMGRRIGLGVVALLAVGACSQPGVGESTDLPASNGVADLTPADSPLADYLGLVGLLDDEQDERQRQQLLAYEEAISLCMAEQGFDYVPDVGTTQTAATADEALEGLGQVEYARQAGYGIYLGHTPELPVDPNSVALAQMSAAEQAAWSAALDGVASEGEIDPIDGEPRTLGRCRGEVGTEVYAYDETGDPYANPEFAELLADVAEIDAAVQATPRMAALDAAWAECMTQAGQPGLTQPWDAVNLVSEFAVTYAATDRNSPGAVEYAPENLAAIQEYEREVATADATCQVDLDYVDLALEIRFDLEHRLLTERRGDFTRLADTYGTDQQ